jgi:hypothetical protein
MPFPSPLVLLPLIPLPLSSPLPPFLVPFDFVPFIPFIPLPPPLLGGVGDGAGAGGGSGAGGGGGVAGGGGPGDVVHPQAVAVKGGSCTQMAGSIKPNNPSCSKSPHDPVASPNVMVASLSIIIIILKRSHILKRSFLVTKKRKIKNVSEHNWIVYML